MEICEIIDVLKEYKDKKFVVERYDNGQCLVDFGHIFSWRGAYEYPAAMIVSLDNPKVSKINDVSYAIDCLKDVDGKPVHGWKGGVYELSEDDPIFLVPYIDSAGDHEIISNIYYDTQRDIVVLQTDTDCYW